MFEFSVFKYRGRVCGCVARVGSKRSLGCVYDTLSLATTQLLLVCS